MIVWPSSFDFRGSTLFKLGRRKKRFNERYNRIGSGQRIGNQDVEAELLDEAQVAGEDSLDEAMLPEAAEGHDSETPQDLMDPLQVYHDGGDPDEYGDADGPALSSFDLAGESETNAVPDDPVPSENPDLPRIHANGHDYAEGDEDLPAWVDTYDPEKPPVKPPELPEAPEEVPDMAGEALPETADEQPDDARKTPRVQRGKDKSEPEAKAAEPAPSWLDVADEVESRPPPMEYDAESVPPEPDQDDPAENEPQEPVGVAEANPLVDDGEPVEQAAAIPEPAAPEPAAPESPTQEPVTQETVEQEPVAPEPFVPDLGAPIAAAPNDGVAEQPAAEASPDGSKTPDAPTAGEQTPAAAESDKVDPVDVAIAAVVAMQEARVKRLPVKPVAPPLPLPLP